MEKLKKLYNKTNIVPLVVFLIIAVLTCFTRFSINTENLCNSYSSILKWVSVGTILILSIFIIIKKAYIIEGLPKVFPLICIVIASIFTSLAYMYAMFTFIVNYDSNDIKFLILLIILNILFITYVYNLIEKLSYTNTIKGNLGKLIKNKKTIFLSIFTVYLIVLLCNYPGTFMYDPYIELCQFLHIPNITSTQVILIDEAQYITTHHSVLHTYLLGLFYTFGNLIGSIDIGLFLFSLTQIGLLALVFSYMFDEIRNHIPEGLFIIFYLIFLLHPVFSMYGILYAKDGLFLIVFVWFGTLFFRYFKNKDLIKDKKWLISISLSIILCSLIRNNAIYVFSITFLIFFILNFKENKKTSIIPLVSLLLVYVIVTSVIYPSLKITKGSRREYLSVFFQQVTYYAKNYGISEEEKEIVNKVIDYDYSVEHFNMELADNVKNTYKKESTNEDLKEFLSLWLKLGLKHPLCYIDCYLGNYYGFFSLRPNSVIGYGHFGNSDIRELLIKDGINIPKNTFSSGSSSMYSYVYIIIFYLPLLNLIMISGIYIWLILYSIYKNGWNKNILFYLPYLLYFCSLLIGPANASLEYRYVIPFLCSLPLILSFYRERRDLK